MKVLNIFCTATIVAMMAISCNDADDPTTPDTGNDNGSGGDETTMIVTASGPNTRTATHLGTQVWWSEGDAISIFKEEDGSAVEFTSDITTDASSADFAGERFSNEGDLYYAIYPYNAAHVADYQAERVTFELSDTQKYNASGFDQGVYMSAAKATDLGDVTFSHILGGLQFSLKGVGTVTSVVVSTSDSKMLSGTAVVDMSLSTPAIESISGGGATVTLDCGEEGVVLDESEQLFTIALPPTNSSTTLNVTINFLDNDIAEEKVIDWVVVSNLVKQENMDWEVNKPAVLAGYYTITDIATTNGAESDSSYCGVYLNSSITLTGEKLNEVTSVYVGDYEATIDAGSQTESSLTFAISNDYTYTTATGDNFITLDKGDDNEQMLSYNVKVYPMYYYEDVELRAKFADANTDGKTYTSTAIAFNINTGKTMSTDELQALEKYVCAATPSATPTAEYLDIDPYFMYAPPTTKLAFYGPSNAGSMMKAFTNSSGVAITSGSYMGTPIVYFTSLKSTNSAHSKVADAILDRSIENLNGSTFAPTSTYNNMAVAYNTSAATANDFYSYYYTSQSMAASSYSCGVVGLAYYNAAGSSILKQVFIVLKSQTGATCAGSGSFYIENTTGKSTITIDVIVPKYDYTIN